MTTQTWSLRVPLTVLQGSYDPIYWTFTNPDTGALIDLTASGFLVTGAVVDFIGGVTTLTELVDGVVWQRTAEGRIYFAPPSVVSSAWGFSTGYYQAELSHPLGETVRFAEGPFTLSFDYVT